ncbi:selenide, water dikinase SelD [Cyanobium sp. Morenito 9A2]|uniref:selenide, water dikinase SelD n=1 Tax=Cyanobium sp. Morenito 9A2 TaxID=2823718 RepID=UPI0020CE34EA|nr:selenide, water dikinase SelD [Cyanobium sp. Morenito 9A2]MCP9849570.1 selenide, water dikinase SelD [Cyanobium sp. Morenito 9A2]
MKPAPEALHQLLLAGGGHSHALVLKRWVMHPQRRPKRCLITLVSRASTALYSGMVPGLVAGLYPRDACAIDLRRLCRLAGVSFVRAEIVALDRERRELRLAGRAPLRWDLLSLDVGAETAAVADGAVAVKPLEPFLDWCAGLDAGAFGQAAERRILGGGAAAVELALALRRSVRPRLVLRGERLHLGSKAANACGERLLARAGIAIERNAGDTGTGNLACTGSRAPAWLAASGLATDPASGRLRTEATLQVAGEADVFASGDCALMDAAPRPPSGVWAVRAAPVLAANLERRLALQANRAAQGTGRPLRRWHPQPWALQLLGDGGALHAAEAGQPQAVAFWGPFALGPSPLLWRWKNRIDRRFMAGFADLGAMTGSPDESAAAMACRGCAAKLAAAPLRNALARLDPGATSDPNDAPVVGATAEGGWLLQSVDGFPALVDDPWLSARLTTLHACSDLWACGAQLQSVQALVTLPRLGESLQEELLVQTLAGVRAVLDPLGARLLGGHSLQRLEAGEELSLALTVNGKTPPGRLWAKGGLRPGDALLLSRAIGSGVLFAAAQAGAARPEWIDGALALMGQSQAELVELLAGFEVHACTDITGFGLLGHLGEMVEASHRTQPGLTVALEAAAIPSLEGALPLLERGFASSLAPANARALVLLEGPIQVTGLSPGVSRRALEGLLVDPQTCGPLLVALPSAQAPEALQALRGIGFPQATVIGRVSPG